ncbi:MAG: hypothetical protein ABGY41_05335 [Candidatus Poribacteria bacterium]
MQHRFPVVLREGANVLLMKMTRKKSHWQAAACFVDAEGLRCSTSAADSGRPLTPQQHMWVPITDEPAEPVIRTLNALDGALIAGTEGHGVLRFDDEASGWRPMNEGLPPNEYVFAYDSLRLNNTLYMATSHGVYTLDSGAERWQRRSDGMTDSYVTEIDGEDDFILVATWEGRMYRSEDDGSTWEQVFGLPAAEEAVVFSRPIEE